MSPKHRFFSIAAALLMVVVAGCASTQRGPTERDGLVRQFGTDFGAVFIKPDDEIPSY